MKHTFIVFADTFKDIIASCQPLIDYQLRLF